MFHYFSQLFKPIDGSSKKESEFIVAKDYLRVLTEKRPDFCADRIYSLGETVVDEPKDIDQVARLFLDSGCTALRDLPSIDVEKDFLRVIFAVSRDGKGWVTIVVDPFELYLNSYIARDLGEIQVDLIQCDAQLLYPVDQ